MPPPFGFVESHVLHSSGNLYYEFARWAMAETSARNIVDAS